MEAGPISRMYSWIRRWSLVFSAMMRKAGSASSGRPRRVPELLDDGERPEGVLALDQELAEVLPVPPRPAGQADHVGDQLGPLGQRGAGERPTRSRARGRSPGSARWASSSWALACWTTSSRYFLMCGSRILAAVSSANLRNFSWVISVLPSQAAARSSCSPQVASSSSSRIGSVRGLGGHRHLPRLGSVTGHAPHYARAGVRHHVRRGDHGDPEVQDVEAPAVRVELAVDRPLQAPPPGVVRTRGRACGCGGTARSRPSPGRSA